MIYRNDEPYSLTAKDKKIVYDFLGWKNTSGILEDAKKTRPAVIAFTETMYTYDRANKRKVRPSMVNLPLESVIFDEVEGSVKWNYSERPVQKSKDGVMSYRKYYSMTGTFSLSYDKIDFLFFLISKSNLRELSEKEKADNVEQLARPFYRVENKEAEAKAKLEKQRRKYEIQGYINGPDGVRWETDKVRMTAVVFGLANAHEMEDYELRSTLLGRLEGEINGWERFYELTDMQVETNMRYQIEICKNNKTIMYNGKARKWYWLENQKDKGAEICAMNSSFVTPEEALLKAMQLDDTIRLNIQNCVDIPVE
jgi:hypothetical protein